MSAAYAYHDDCSDCRAERELERAAEVHALKLREKRDAVGVLAWIVGATLIVGALAPAWCG